MDNKTITIATGLHLGAALCRPHLCSQCGVQVDESATHGLSCCRSVGCHHRHNAINDIICRSLSAAGVPCQPEPQNLVRQDGKCSDGVTVLPWKCGHPLVWDATCSNTFAPSYTNLASTRAGSVADLAEHRKAAQYTNLQFSYLFSPVSIETLGSFGIEKGYLL